MFQNIRIGLRSLRRTPGFAITAILTLGLGIGLAIAVFTVAEAFLLRPLPVRDQDRVVVLWGAKPGGRFDGFPLLLADARDFARHARSLERVEFFSYGGALPLAIRDGSTVFRARRALVSGGYFPLLGTPPELGRPLQPEDDVAGAAPVAVLSHGAWQRYFGGDPGVIGRRLVMHQSGVAHTVVGVMPLGLDYPRGTEVWAPVIPNSGPLGEHPVYAELNVLGRLRPGASASDARAELTAYFARPGAPEWTRDVRGVVHPLTNAILGDVRPAVLAFAAAAGLLLLITCINVANLQLVRGLARVREIAVRSALGAARRRIVGQLITESALLALGGAILGTVLAVFAVDAFVAFAPATTPRLEEIRLNGAAIAGAVAITGIVTLLFAIAPAVITSRVELQEALRSGSRQSGASRRFRHGTEALVVGQVALALLVLSAAGVIARSLTKLERVDLALEPSQLLIGELAVPHEGFDDTRKQVALIERLVPRLEAIPGVGAVAPVLTAPFVAVGGIFGQLAAEGQTADEVTRNPTLIFDVVTPSYFSTFGIPVVRGRAIADGDREGSPPVVVLSESAARHYWPGADPIGKRLTWGSGETSVTVVGIVPETRYRDLRDPRPTVYFPLRQTSFPVTPMTLAIRSTGRSAGLVPAIRSVIRETEPGVELVSAAPFTTFLEQPLAQPRLNALLLGVFAVAAVALAAVGLFGVMTAMVRQRTRELGLRMALGATAANVERLVLWRGMALAAIGTSVGVLGALAGNRLLAAMLFEVSPTDSVTLTLATVTLLGVAALASLVPARSSTRIEPAISLQAE
ncbi:MAG: ABC transporter permease [Gemmatimonadaceae bacterium]